MKTIHINEDGKEKYLCISDEDSSVKIRVEKSDLINLQQLLRMVLND